jgi:hypothetical protein
MLYVAPLAGSPDDVEGTLSRLAIDLALACPLDHLQIQTQEPYCHQVRA